MKIFVKSNETINEKNINFIIFLNFSHEITNILLWNKIKQKLQTLIFLLSFYLR